MEASQGPGGTLREADGLRSLSPLPPPHTPHPEASPPPPAVSLWVLSAGEEEGSLTAESALEAAALCSPAGLRVEHQQGVSSPWGGGRASWSCSYVTGYFGGAHVRLALMIKGCGSRERLPPTTQCLLGSSQGSWMEKYEDATPPSTTARENRG